MVAVTVGLMEEQSYEHMPLFAKSPSIVQVTVEFRADTIMEKKIRNTIK